MAIVDLLLDGEIALLSINYPPVNALSAATRTALGDALDRAIADDAVRAIVVMGGGTTFIAGADIGEFGTDKTTVKPLLKDLQRKLEASPKLTIAAIHGTALGGGLELALTAHARVAVASAKLGLPEVALGLLPGAGGTQRLARLTGVEAALDLITSGKHIGAARALELGIIDAIVDDLAAGAVALAWEIARDDILCVAIRPRAFDGTLPMPDKFAQFQAFERRTGVPMVGTHPFAQNCFPRGEEVGRVVAWLARGEAMALNGRVLQVGGGEIGLWAEPAVERSLLRTEEWDGDALDAALPLLMAGVRDPRAALNNADWREMATRRVTRADPTGDPA